MTRMTRFDPNCDYYQILNVSSTASSQEIRRSFRTMVKSIHPDLPHNTYSSSHHKIRQIITAYRILSDANTRSQYDIARSHKVARFNFRTFLQQRTGDWHSQARLILYDLLHHHNDSAIKVYETYFSIDGGSDAGTKKTSTNTKRLKDYMEHNDYMDCAFLLSEIYEKRGDYSESWDLLVDIIKMEMQSPYFKDFFIEIYQGFKRLASKGLNRTLSPSLHHNLNGILHKYADLL